MIAFTGIAPLTLTLSPEGRGDDGAEGAAQRAKGMKVHPRQVERARELRTRMSDAERRLWYFLRDRRLAGFKFVRQFPIGRYYADFACREAMLVVEADGGQHGGLRDAVRDQAITSAGYTVLRFWNDDILHRTETVLERIHGALGSCVPSPLWGEGQGEGPSSSLNHE